MSRFPGVGEWIARRADRTPDHIALVFEGRYWTYAALSREIERIARGLLARGVGRGARVAYLGVNHPAFLATFFACARLGAALTPINWRLAQPEVRYIIEDSDASLLVYDEALAATVEPLATRCPADFLVRNDLGLDPVLGAVESDRPLPEAPHPGSGDDMLTLMYTSGTSGRPKGVMISHDNVLASIMSHDATFGLGPGHVALVMAPLFHIGGLNVNLLNTFLKGGTVVLERGFDPGRILSLIVEHRVNSFFAAPVMLQMMQTHPDFADADLSSVLWIYGGGAPVDERLVRSFADRGIMVCQGLGMTEATPVVATTGPHDALAKIGSVGKPGYFVDVRVVDELGKDVAPTQRGEIVIGGANVIRGYWNRPEATADAIRDGWFHTGDVGSFDEDGYLYVVDRLKDMIISGGENIASAEVEACLLEHPGVAEAAVVGKPHETWGEVPVAFVVAPPGSSVTPDDISSHTSARLARFKQPAEVYVVSALPRNAAGKLLKHQLRGQLADSTTIAPAAPGR